MPGSQAWASRLEPPLDQQAGWPGHYIKVRRCGGLSMVPLQLKDTLESFMKRRGFLLGSGLLSRFVAILPLEAVGSDVKPHVFLPSV